MQLNPFEQEVLENTSNAEDFMRWLFGEKVGKDNARKQKTGIQKFLRLKKRMEEPDPSGLDKLTTKEDGTQTTVRMVMLSEEERKDPNRLMTLMGYDPLMWECIQSETIRNDWPTTMKLKDDGGEEYPKSIMNHQYKVTLRVKPRQDLISMDAIKRLFDGLNVPALKPVKYDPGEMMFELPMMDVHLMNRSDVEESGEKYDLETAVRQYRETVEDIYGKLKAIDGLRFEKVLLPFGQDFFHYDNIDRTTKKGTAVENDGPFYKMYEAGIDLMLWTVEAFRQLAPVEVIWVPGNHDWTMSYFAVSGLARIYDQVQGVSVNIQPTPRKYVRFGRNLIGYSHGSEEGKRISTIMQQEAAEDWGQTRFREWHLGHMHHEEAKEDGGIVIRRISSITAADGWHTMKGYKSIRKAEGFVWDKERGKVYTISSCVMM